MTKRKINEMVYAIIGAAIDVNRELGPGLLESIYEKCFIHALRQKGMVVSSQQKIPLIFQGIELDCELRLDLLVENEIVVEIKAIDRLLPIHEAQLLTYLKLLDKAKGILINFNCTNIFKEGQKTMATAKFADLED